MSEKYTPFLGEYAQIRDATKKNKYSMLYITEYKTSHPEWDLGLVFSKNVPYFYAYSPKAVEEFLGKKIMLVSYNFFVALVPDKIDTVIILIELK